MSELKDEYLRYADQQHAEALARLTAPPSQKPHPHPILTAVKRSTG